MSLSPLTYTLVLGCMFSFLMVMSPGELLCHRQNLYLIVGLPAFATVASPLTFQYPNFFTDYGIRQHSILNLFLQLFKFSLFLLNFQMYWYKTLHYIPLFYSVGTVRYSPWQGTCPEPPPQSPQPFTRPSQTQVCSSLMQVCFYFVNFSLLLHSLYILCI